MPTSATATIRCYSRLRFACVACRDNPTEPNWQLQAIVIALSMGPNGPSDYPGHTNRSLVMSTIRGDGFTMQVRLALLRRDAARPRG